ncbi:hypothetical protein EVAR_2746_1 [Eumeta japonica]|uniref:Uncharacterized protein n=1 Tax=Eumeta variegata TaxID=151549 RepID=A0A4C1T0C0_EUMVA|nr:hypothetical protein EVAR_2746_1 [Eumeta japonica]
MHGRRRGRPPPPARNNGAGRLLHIIHGEKACLTNFLVSDDGSAREQGNILILSEFEHEADPAKHISRRSPSCLRVRLRIMLMRLRHVSSERSPGSS